MNLGPGPDPVEVIDALADEPGLACLWGEWTGAGTSVLIMSRPRATSRDPAALDSTPAATDPDHDLIGGGWVGWLGYDAPHYLAFYDHLLRWDEESGRWSFEALWTRRRTSALRARREQLRALLATSRPHEAKPTRVGEFSGANRAHHLAAVEQAIGLIRAGEIYQANICTRIGAEFDASTADAARLFARAAASVRPRFGAFIDGGDRIVLSLSPELFLRRHRDHVSSSPIKGTWARDPGNPADDGADRLRRSAKDVAENVMIVDLVRNDLGRVCRPGSVHVKQLLAIAPHPGIWHLVSTVAGRLRASVGDAELIEATFPPGSVTGTPKIRALDVINELEPVPRGVYTGAIGLASPSAGLLLSVAIRTFELADGRIELGVGGGITADSVPELEWRECVQKAAPLLRAIGARAPVAFTEVAGRPAPWQLAGGLIETLLAVDGRLLRLGDHLARLDRSARELYGFGVPAGLSADARAAVAGSSGRVVVRIVLAPSGAVEVTAGPARPRPAASELRTVTRTGVWRHKWADRTWVDVDALYLDADGRVLETERGNVFALDIGGALITAPLGEDLLPGVTRRAILDLAGSRGWPARIEPLPLASLSSAAAAFWTSSLSGIVSITAVDGRPLPTSEPAALRLEQLAAGLGF